MHVCTEEYLIGALPRPCLRKAALVSEHKCKQNMLNRGNTAVLISPGSSQKQNNNRKKNKNKQSICPEMIELPWIWLLKRNVTKMGEEGGTVDKEATCESFPLLLVGNWGSLNYPAVCSRF